MVMNKTLFTTLVISGFLYGALAYADSHTVAVGFAQSKVQDFKHIRGVNLHYRYEWDYPVSIIGSLAYMKGSEHTRSTGENYVEKGSGDVKYYSLMVGPAYRINDYVSIYGLLGFSHFKVDYSYHESERINDKISSYHGNENRKSTNFAYGAGIEVNPIQYLSIYAGYEGSEEKFNDKSFNINGFNIGVGYRF
ncbi:Virulence membrane protein pagC precursor [Xenorhabdus nematophila str. Anatoliense]|nr:Virulence membrane protein pagC precursor [Xenorhabdus nematophila str. Anatoliense]CEE93412.1 Virulence membrane protein pagC precursor [Xenorhabdus nematophila str. Anatoliense]